MKKIAPVLFLIGVVLVSGCIDFSAITFKECRLDYDKIKEDQVAKLWIEIENKGDVTQDVELWFIYPETVTIESKGEKVKGFNVTVDPKGATSGRKFFNVYGDYIAGQPSSPWDVKVQIYSGGELITERELTITILPP